VNRLDFSLVELLGYFYEAEMKRAYESLWYDMAVHKKPWSLTKIMANLSKFASIKRLKKNKLYFLVIFY
jgi:hypothetical protein